MAEDLNQYTTSKVQVKDFTSGWLVAVIIAGTGLTLPILYLGSEVALAVGFKNALWAFGISTLVLTLMCLVTTIIGNRSRLSTYMILHFSFGKHGAKIINTIFGITLLGWFAVSLELLAIAVKDTALETFNIIIPEFSIIIVIGTLIIVTTVYGIKSLEKLSKITVPLLTVFLAYVVYQSLQKVSLSEIVAFAPENPTMTLFQATSILVGSSILFPVIMADFSRFVYNDKHSLIAVLGITLGFPIALLFSAIPSIQSGEVNIIKVMKGLDLVLPAFFLLFVSTWVGNASNLYSTSLTFSTVNTKWTYKKTTLIMGALGIVLGLFGFSDYLFGFLDVLGVLSPSISSIYIINFFLVRQQKYQLNAIKNWEYPALISWVSSSIITLFTYFEVFQLTHAYFIDSLLLGAIIYLQLMKKNISIYNKND